MDSHPSHIQLIFAAQCCQYVWSLAGWYTPQVYLPVYALAPFVVYTSATSAVVYGGVYAIGAGGQGCFYPRWVAA